MRISKQVSATAWNHLNLDHSTPFETASKRNNVIRLADCRDAKPDPAYSARLRMIAAGEDDDDAYMRAIVDLETLPATSLLGVRAKLERLHFYFEFFKDTLEGGGEIGSDDWEIVFGLYDAIDRPLEKFTAQVA
jgi:hypothetical protein